MSAQVRRSAPRRSTPEPPTILLLALLVLAALWLIAALSGCAAEVRPYARVIEISDYQLDWFSDGPDVVVVVRNPTPRRARLRVLCGGASPWEVELGPGGEARALGRVVNRDLRAEPCAVEVLP